MYCVSRNIVLTAGIVSVAGLWGLPGFGIETVTLADSQPIVTKYAKFARSADSVPVDAVFITLTPEVMPVFRWTDKTEIQVAYHNGEFIFTRHAPGKDVAIEASIPAEQLRVAVCGTRLLAFDDEGKCIALMRGGARRTGVELEFPDGVVVPEMETRPVFLPVLGILHLRQSIKELDEYDHLLAQHAEVLKKFFAVAPQAYSEWILAGNQIRSAVNAKMKEFGEECGGVADALLSDPEVLDRFNVFLQFAADFRIRPDYMGDIFDREYHHYLGGIAEAQSARNNLRKVKRLLERAYRVTKSTPDGWIPIVNADETPVAVAAWGDADAVLFPDKPYLGASTRAMNLNLAGGEGESCQLLIAGVTTEPTDISVSIKSLTGPGVPDKRVVELYNVDCVRLTEAITEHLEADGDGDTRYPDILIPAENGTVDLQLAEGENASVWIDVKLPDDFAAGDYTATIAVEADGKETEMPLTFHVYDFSLGTDRPMGLPGLRQLDARAFFDRDGNTEASREALLAGAKVLMRHNFDPTDIYSSSPLEQIREEVVKPGSVGLVTLGDYTRMAPPRPDMPEKMSLYGQNADGTREQIPGKWQLIPSEDSICGDALLRFVPENGFGSYPTLVAVYENKDHNNMYGYFRVSLDGDDGVVFRDVEGGTVSEPIENAFATEEETAVSEEFTDGFAVSLDLSVAGRDRNGITFKNLDPDAVSLDILNCSRSRLIRYYGNNLAEFQRLGGKEQKTLLFGFDEAGREYNEDLRQALLCAKKAFPDTLCATTAPEIGLLPELYELLDVFCPTGVDFYVEDLEKLGKEKMFLYVGGSPYYPYPTFERVDQKRLYSRAFFWPLLSYDLSGWLYWNINMWRKNTDVELQFPECFDTWNTSWNENNSGMGSLLYPWKENSVVPSARLLAMRDGIEDWQYVRILQRLLANEEIPAAERKAMTAELENIRRKFSPGMTGFCESRDEINALRTKLADMIESLQKQE